MPIKQFDSPATFIDREDLIIAEFLRIENAREQVDRVPLTLRHDQPEHERRLVLLCRFLWPEVDQALRLFDVAQILE